jgi:L-asparaginase II
MVILDRQGNVEVAIGDYETVVFPRSSLKPLQAFAMIRQGLELPDESMALVCASHNGTPRHCVGVQKILQHAGLDESLLANTPDLPLGQEEAEEILRSGGGRTSVQQNCSGKHAGMLATCQRQGWPIDSSYLAMDHPLQQQITSGIEFLAGESVSAIGIDGCGAPTHAVSLVGLARAFRYLAMGADAPARTVHRAMTSFPEMVGGPGHVTSRLMQAVPGLMAKDGAEGVFGMAFPDGRSMALKVADGANRARPPLVRAALERMGVSVDLIDKEIFESVVLGHGQRVGEVRIVGDVAAFRQR